VRLGISIFQQLSYQINNIFRASPNMCFRQHIDCLVPYNRGLRICADSRRCSRCTRACKPRLQIHSRTRPRGSWRHTHHRIRESPLHKHTGMCPDPAFHSYRIRLKGRCTYIRRGRRFLARRTPYTFRYCKAAKAKDSCTYMCPDFAFGRRDSW